MTKHAVVVLEVMWDWRAQASRAGYERPQAPNWFKINPENHSGRRLHAWLQGYEFVVTNACPELVSKATERGTPSPAWLHRNLTDIHQTIWESTGKVRAIDLLLVCGKVAQATYDRGTWLARAGKVIEMPHPAMRLWTTQGVQLVANHISNSSPHSVHIWNDPIDRTFKSRWL